MPSRYDAARLRIDFGPTSSDYARYRPPIAAALFDRLRREHGIGLPGQNVLDVGAGTGLLARGLESRGACVTAIDPVIGLLRRAPLRRRVAARAEQLPFDDAVFDVVTAAQCWHWFDRRTAPMELLRVLRFGGTLAVIYQTHVPMPGSVAEATERLILRHMPGWRHANSTGINGQVLRDIQIAGFERIESFSFDADIDFTREAWRGFIRTTSPVGASMTPPMIDAFDAEHAAVLLDWPAQLRVPHRIFAAVAHRPQSRI